MKKLFVFLFLSLFFISFASAEDFVFKQTTNVDLKVPCFNNGSYCSGSATCNLTIIRQDGSILIQNKQMQNQGSFHNYTLLKHQTTSIGDNAVSVICKDGSYTGYSTFSYLISPSGQDDNNIKQLIVLGMAIIFSIGMIFLGFYKNEPYLVMFGSIGMVLLGLYTLNNGIGNYRTTLTEAISYIILFSSAYIGLRTSLEIIDDARIE